MTQEKVRDIGLMFGVKLISSITHFSVTPSLKSENSRFHIYSRASRAIELWLCDRSHHIRRSHHICSTSDI